MKDTVTLRVLNGGRSYNAHGVLTLTLVLASHNRDQFGKFWEVIGRRVGNTFYCKAKVDDRLMALGTFSLKNIGISGGDGTAKIKLQSADNFVETANVNALPMQDESVPEFLVRFEITVDDEED